MHGAYEERHEAMSLVRSIDAVVDADVIERSIERVEAAVDAAQADSDIDRLSLLTELLAALKDAS